MSSPRELRSLDDLTSDRWIVARQSVSPSGLKSIWVYTFPDYEVSAFRELRESGKVMCATQRQTTVDATTGAEITIGYTLLAWLPSGGSKASRSSSQEAPGDGGRIFRRQVVRPMSSHPRSPS